MVKSQTFKLEQTVITIYIFVKIAIGDLFCTSMRSNMVLKVVSIVAFVAIRKLVYPNGIY
jgi:hypothetical protein